MPGPLTPHIDGQQLKNIGPQPPCHQNKDSGSTRTNGASGRSPNDGMGTWGCSSNDVVGRRPKDFAFPELLDALRSKYEMLEGQLVLLQRAKRGSIGNLSSSEGSAGTTRVRPEPLAEVVRGRPPTRPNVVCLDAFVPMERRLSKETTANTSLSKESTANTSLGQVDEHCKDGTISSAASPPECGYDFTHSDGSECGSDFQAMGPNVEGLTAVRTETEVAKRDTDDSNSNSLCKRRSTGRSTIDTEDDSNSNSLGKRRSTKSSVDTFSLTYPLCPVWLPEGVGGTPRSSFANLPMMTQCSSINDKIVCGGDTLRSRTTLQKLVIGPNCRFRIMWDLMSMVLLIHDLLLLPMMVFGIGESKTTEVISYLTTIFWSVDIAMSFCTGYHYLGVLEMRPGMIASRYVRSWFCFDVMVVSLDWVCICLQTIAYGITSTLRQGSFLRVARILRLFRLARAIKMSSLMEAFADFFQSPQFSACSGVIQSLIGILTINHLIACIWYGLGSMGMDPQWTSAVENESIAYRYATSLHWSLTQFTPATMEIHPTNTVERIYTMVVLLSAMIIFGSFVGKITQLMTKLREGTAVRYKEQENMRRYISDNRVSHDLGRRISAFMHGYKFHSRRRVHETDITTFKVLPSSLLLQLRWEVYRQQLMPHPLFDAIRTVDKSALIELCNTAMSEIFLATSEEVFRPGIRATRMLFFLSGALIYGTGASELCTYVIRPRPKGSDMSAGSKQLFMPWMSEVSLWIHHYYYMGRMSVLAPTELFAMNASAFRALVSQQSPTLIDCLRLYAAAFRDELLARQQQGFPAGSKIATERGIPHDPEIWNELQVLQDITIDAFPLLPTQEK